MDREKVNALANMGSELVNLYKKALRNVEHLSTALNNADLVNSSKYLKEIENLNTEISQRIMITTAQIETTAASARGIEELRENALSIAKDTFPDVPVFLCEGCLVVHPIVVKFEQQKDDLKVLINGVAVSTYSAQRVVDEIEKARKKNFESVKFLRSLHACYKTLCSITARTSIPLEEIRQVFSISSDSTNMYTRDMFEADLQRWNSSDAKEIAGKTAHLQHVAAAQDGYPIISANGSRSLLSNISFSSSNEENQ